MRQDNGAPSKMESGTFSFGPPDPKDGSMRNLRIRNKHDGQVLDVQRADAPGLADELEDMARRIRASYNINK
jgi:hypothetical protein